MSARKRKSNSCSETANVGLTIFDAPNVCREIMARCQSLANRLEDEYGSEIDESLAQEARAIRAEAEKMLDAIVASVDQILAVETAATSADAA